MPPFRPCGRNAADRAVLRAIHFYADNARVPKQVEALRQGDFDKFLALVTESGHSSYMYLQNVTPAGYVEHQDVAVTLALCEKYLQGRGAYRVHGGRLRRNGPGLCPLRPAGFLPVRHRCGAGRRGLPCAVHPSPGRRGSLREIIF